MNLIAKRASMMSARLKSSCTKSIVTAALFACSHGPLFAANVTVVISGLGGSEEYSTQFDDYATAIADETRLIAQTPNDVMLLRGDAAKKDIVTALFDAIATREDIDKFSAFFIGHGTFDGRTYKFNIPGPDITGDEIAGLLNRVRSRQQLVVAATSASGALLESIDSGNNDTGQRVVMTATKNGREKTAVIFPEYLVEAITTPGADTDKNESISAEEIFDYVNRSVEEFYSTEKLLAPEHARLNGENAATFEVVRYGTLLDLQNRIPDELLTTRENLSNQINILRSRKEDIDEDEYFDSLQGLMLKLADVQRQIDDETTQSEN